MIRVFNLSGLPFVFVAVFVANVEVSALPRNIDASTPVISQGEDFLKNRDRQRKERLLNHSAISVPKQELEPVSDAKCIQINKISVQGVTVFPLQEVLRITSPLEGHCLGPNLLSNTLKKINNYYIESGHITSRAYLPKQKIGKNRILNILVIEGVIESISLNDGSKKDVRKKKVAFPIGIGEKLQLRKIEQGLDQLNRVKSANAKMKLWPGDKIGGTKIVVTNNPADEMRGYITFDNEGQEASGSERIRFGLEKDNILGFNDSWSLYYIGSRDTNALALEVSSGYKNWDFSYAWSNSEYVSFLTENTELYGLSDTHTFKVKRLYHRDGSSKTQHTLELVARDPRRYINDVELTPTPSGHIRFGIDHTDNKNNKHLQLSTGITAGLNLYEKPSKIFNDSFIKFDVGLSRSGAWHKRWQYKNEFNLQYSSSSLFSSEQINIGSLHTVRGFVETPLSGDSGLYVRNTATYFPECSGQGQQKSLCEKIRPYIFTDAGLVYAKQKNRFGEKLGWLGGVGAGLKFGGKHLTLDLGLSKGLAASHADIDTGLHLYATATYKVF